MSLTRFFTRVLEALLLVAVFVISATIAALACSVMSRTVVAQHIEECVNLQVGDELIPNMIYKWERNLIIFSDNAPKTVEVYGFGMCNSPTFGSQVKCYPAFDNPTSGACTPAASNCVRWKQFIQSKAADCGLFSCSLPGCDSEYVFY